MSLKQQVLEKKIILVDIIKQALAEDIGTGDLTSDSIIGPEKPGVAALISKEEFVIAGLQVFCETFRLISRDIEFDLFYRDGDDIKAGERILLVRGPVGSILKAERTALNFFQRMSGIATMTREYVNRVEGAKAKVVDTRKTVPGLRVLDKYAVKTGGGSNHRLGLHDGVLIKDNHIEAAGSITDAVRLARENVPHTLKIEVEVEDRAGVEEALKAGADIIMLDNMSISQMKDAVEFVKGRALLEASGNITLGNIKEVSETGVDIISVGALTHSPRAVDVSLKIVNEKE